MLKQGQLPIKKKIKIHETKGFFYTLNLDNIDIYQYWNQCFMKIKYNSAVGKVSILPWSTHGYIIR